MYGVACAWVLLQLLLRLAGAGAVGVAGVGTPAVLPAVVPAGALLDLLGLLADVGLGVVDLSLGAAQLVGLLSVEAGEEELAVGRVGVERVLVEQALAADLGRAGAGEAVDALGLDVDVTAHLGLGGELVLPDAGAELHVEHERRGAGHLEGGALVAGVELVAHSGVLVVEEAVGAGAPGVDAGLGLLHERPVAAVDVVRQLADLVVAPAVVEQQAVVAQLGHELAVRADVVQVALLGIRELAVRLRAAEVELGTRELGVLGLGGHQGDGEEGENEGLHRAEICRRLVRGWVGGRLVIL